MPCTHINLGNGAHAIVCGPKQKRPHCSACGRPVEHVDLRLCDWKAPGKKSGTCDRVLCARHATSVGPDRDLCPEHADAWAAHPKNPARRPELTSRPPSAHILTSSTRKPTA